MNLALWYIAATLAAAVALAGGEWLYPDRGLEVLFAVSPALIAFAFAARDRERPLAALGWRPRFAFWPTVISTTAAMTAALLATAWALGHTQLNERSLRKFLDLSTLLALALGILVNTGEEAGWRGYLFPKLDAQLGWWRAIAVTTLVWWAWHVPFMAVLQLRATGSIQWSTQLIQLAGLAPASVILACWYRESGSFWVVGFAHQLVNFADKWLLGLEHAAKTPIAFADKSHVHLYGLENGVLGLAAGFVTAALVYRRYRRAETLTAPARRSFAPTLQTR